MWVIYKIRPVAAVAHGIVDLLSGVATPHAKIKRNQRFPHVSWRAVTGSKILRNWANRRFFVTFGEPWLALCPQGDRR
jgi:hypothetical protein